MKKLLMIVLFLLLVIGIWYYTKNDEVAVNEPEVEDVMGCYVARLGQDVYSLNIDEQNGNEVAGTLVFDNFQKDSSFGTFVGTYEEGILWGNYYFQSEGMNSISQTIFQKQGDAFVRGFGPVEVVGDTQTFTDLNSITYDPNQTFRKTDEECQTTLI